MSTKCVIKGCSSNVVGRNSMYHSYIFPKPEKSPERYAKWLQLTERRSVSKHSKVCAIHFEQSDFNESDMLKIRLTPNLFKNMVPKLKKGVVPSLHLGDEYIKGGKKSGALSSPYIQIKEVQDILKGAGKPSKNHVDNHLEVSQPTTSWLDPATEMNMDDGEYVQKEMAIQCEFGTEVYRGFNAGSNALDK